MRKIVNMIMPVLLVSLFVMGCGGGVSEDKPLSEIQAEAKTMSAAQLKTIVAKYEQAIQSKKAEIDKIKQEIQKIPIAQMLGDEAKKLKGDMQDITTSLRALADRLNTYSRELSNKK